MHFLHNTCADKLRLSSRSCQSVLPLQHLYFRAGAAKVCFLHNTWTEKLRLSSRSCQSVIYGLPPCAADLWGGGKAPGEFSAWFACRGLKQILFPSPDEFSTGLKTRESSDLKGHEYNMPPPCGRFPERDVSTAPSRAATRCKRIGRGNALC